MFERKLGKQKVQRVGTELQAVSSQSASLSDVLQALEELRSLQRITMDKLNALIGNERLKADSHEDLTRRLLEQRGTERYENAYSCESPLISVIIPTHTAPASLWSRAIPSILGQTHKNVEVLLAINSQFSDVTQSVKDKLDRIADPRLRIVSCWSPSPSEIEYLPYWFSSGSVEVNSALRETRGLWVAPFAHDDELLPNAFESLLDFCRETRAEVAYGDVIQMRGESIWETHCSDPPKSHNFGLQGSIRHAALNHFTYDLRHVMLGLPNDWGIMQRMRLAGVRVAHLCQPTCHYFPSDFH